MMYYIDGYNLLFKVLERNKTFTENRLLIIEELKFFFSVHQLKGCLVFDSRFDLSSNFPSTQNGDFLDIIYSPQGLSADDYLIEILSVSQHPTSITVITSDRYLRDKIRSLGCQLMSIDNFLSWTLKKKKQKKRQSSYKKNIEDSQEDFERLLKIFEKKFKDL